MLIVPVCGGQTPPMDLRKVDLPLPDPPMTMCRPGAVQLREMFLNRIFDGQFPPWH